MAILIRAILAGVVALASLGAITQKVRDQGVTDTEIRIGNVMPYSGALEIFGQIGKAEAAYFEMINERGGINGRKIRFMSYDDLSDPSNAMDLTRILVETDNVLLMFGSFGTPGNLAVRKYLNERQVPQLFVASGDHDLSEPSLYPWTMGWQPSYREEGRIYANYIQAFYPGKKIVALWENDQFGRELFKGLVQGLGDVAHNIRVDIAYDVDDQHLDGHVSILKQSGAEVFVFAGVPENAAKVIRAAGRPRLAAGVCREPDGVIDRDGAQAGRHGECDRRHHRRVPEGCERSGLERRAGRLAQLPGQVCQSRRQG
ncbi:ABC-type branched-subunit amino acid transport system substrate-binding protein [Bradyrhizobium elkanii]